MSRVELVEFIVEEPSMEAALRELLPEILGELPFTIYSHQCKGELLKHLPARLSAYGKRTRNDPWFRECVRIVVVVDCDDDCCVELKSRLEELAEKAGLPTRSSVDSPSYLVLNRIAIEELEAWFFGDWEAVRLAFPVFRPAFPRGRVSASPIRLGEELGKRWKGFCSGPDTPEEATGRSLLPVRLPSTWSQTEIAPKALGLCTWRSLS